MTRYTSGLMDLPWLSPCVIELRELFINDTSWDTWWGDERKLFELNTQGLIQDFTNRNLHLIDDPNPLTLITLITHTTPLEKCNFKKRCFKVPFKKTLEIPNKRTTLGWLLETTIWQKNTSKKTCLRHVRTHIRLCIQTYARI